MDTGKAIEFIEKDLIQSAYNFTPFTRGRMKQTIVLLKRGEAFEKMWKKLDIELLAHYPPQIYADEVRYKIMKKIEQEFFPKG